MPDTSLASVAANLQRVLAPASRGWLRKRAPLLVFLGMLVLAAWLAAKLTWQFAAPSAIPTSQGTAGARPQPQVAQIPAERIVAAHLFGLAAAPGSTVAAVNAPETSLNLTLIGVAAGEKGASSQAIIASGKQGTESTYSVGSPLPGGAIIRQILPDRVILAHDGRLETLRLPVVGTSILAGHMEFGSGASMASNESPELGRNFTEARREIERHPQSFSQFMRMLPDIQNGHLKGYRVYPSKSPALFRRVGLQPGDIVTSVNGVRLDSTTTSIRALSQLRHAQGPVQLQVLRHGKPIALTVNVPGGQL